MSTSESAEGKSLKSTPRWGFIAGVVAIVVVALLVIVHVATGGLDHHTASGVGGPAPADGGRR